MDTQPLRDMGLTEIEISVYFALLEKGPSPTGIIIRKTGLHKATVYQTLERLEEKGVVSYIIQDNRHVFQAEDPTILLEQLKEREENLKAIMPQLHGMAQLAEQQITAKVYCGKKGIISIYRDVFCKTSYRGNKETI